MINVLLTGGAGYIGSHTAVLLIEMGFKVVLFDSLVNSNKSVVDKIEKITREKPLMVVGDIRDTLLLSKTIKNYNIEAVIHFAGLKSVSESIVDPLSYFDVNISGSVSLLKAMQENGCERLVFSSSATVYGHPEYLPLDEDHPTYAINPYGASKLQVEKILASLSDNKVEKTPPISKLNTIVLRYFNPVGSHKSALIGEEPSGIPNNLVPYICNVAGKKLPYLKIYGDDYETIDGTGVRDYIHVMDLASGHLAALKRLLKSSATNGYEVFNLGTGVGTSVMEMLHSFEKNNGVDVPYRIEGRRLGDVDSCFAKVEKASIGLNWRALYSVDEMCNSAWAFKNTRF